MDNENKGGDPESREPHGLKISDLLKALAERKPKPPHATHIIDPGHLSTTISALKDARGTFRSRAVLPDNISRLSKGQYQRWDHLSESSPAPDAAQEGHPQPTTVTSSPFALLQLLEQSKTLPSDSVGERFTKLEIHPKILGVEVWTNQLSMMPPTVSTQTGRVNQWFFENLTDLQRKLFSGASKEHGVSRPHQIPGQETHRNSPESTSSSPPPSL